MRSYGLSALRLITINIKGEKDYKNIITLITLRFRRRRRLLSYQPYQYLRYLDDCRAGVFKDKIKTCVKIRVTLAAGWWFWDGNEGAHLQLAMSDLWPASSHRTLHTESDFETFWAQESPGLDSWPLGSLNVYKVGLCSTSRISFYQYTSKRFYVGREEKMSPPPPPPPPRLLKKEFWAKTTQKQKKKNLEVGLCG